MFNIDRERYKSFEESMKEYESLDIEDSAGCDIVQLDFIENIMTFLDAGISARILRDRFFWIFEQDRDNFGYSPNLQKDVLIQNIIRMVMVLNEAIEKKLIFDISPNAKKNSTKIS